MNWLWNLLDRWRKRQGKIDWLQFSWDHEKLVSAKLQRAVDRLTAENEDLRYQVRNRLGSYVVWGEAEKTQITKALEEANEEISRLQAKLDSHKAALRATEGRSVTPKPTPSCLDCRWRENTSLGDICSRFDPELTIVHRARSPQGRCRQEARYFEPK